MMELILIAKICLKLHKVVSPYPYFPFQNLNPYRQITLSLSSLSTTGNATSPFWHVGPISENGRIGRRQNAISIVLIRLDFYMRREQSSHKTIRELFARHEILLLWFTE